MFTGLIESVGRIDALTRSEQGVRLRIATDLAPELSIGDSLAINGVCLTVVDRAGVDKTTRDVGMDVSPETLRVTTLSELEVGSLVNLERPMRADGRFGGHIVQGHVDGTGIIVTIDAEGEEFYRLTVAYPAPLAPFFIHKGSVAIDGISLTIADLRDDAFAIQIIPHTWAHTNLSAAVPGMRVNLECDLVGKYVMRAADLASRRVTASP
jgi:riboflavin synthase